MQRVLILGCPGAGKSTLARRLAAEAGLPLIHLDQLYWQAGWTEPEPEKWYQSLDTSLTGVAWIMDGNYGQTLARRLSAADGVIFLDLPRWLCLSRALRRIVTSLGRTRADMAQECPERFDWEFLRYIWSFR